MAGVIQPGTSGTPISAGSMKPMPQITTPARAASYGSPRYCWSKGIMPRLTTNIRKA